MTLKDECAHCHGTGAKAGTTPVTCPKCNGKRSGGIHAAVHVRHGTEMYSPVRTAAAREPVIKDKCPHCYGTGYITSPARRSRCTIPAGIDNGQSVRIRGKGEPGTNGGERGDLLVEVVVSQHPIFKRQDTNIYSTVPISFVTGGSGRSAAH